jgi:hypothetical protein
VVEAPAPNADLSSPRSDAKRRITHDFQNRGCERAAVLNFSACRTFEEQMPAIVEWFTDNPPGEAIA